MKSAQSNLIIAKLYTEDTTEFNPMGKKPLPLRTSWGINPHLHRKVKKKAQREVFMFDDLETGETICQADWHSLKAAIQAITELGYAFSIRSYIENDEEEI